jgi:hypothetical protein
VSGGSKVGSVLRAKRAVAWYYDVPLVWSSGTPLFCFPVDGCAEKVCAWIRAARVDVVVPRVVTHLACVLGSSSGICGEVSQ